MVALQFLAKNRAYVLDTIVPEHYNLGDQAILLTNAFEDKILREKCVRLGIKILPLAFIGIVPIGEMFEIY